MAHQNTIYCGDNMDWLQALADESVDLCYIDPPFFSKRNYEVIWGNGYEMRSFDDRFAGGVKHYVSWMTERIQLIYRKLKPTGSFYLHCDYHASHYLKVACDELFGYKNFRNEIVWCYTRMAAKGQKQYSRAHDVILLYSKGDTWTFNTDSVRMPYAKTSKAREGHTLNRLGSGHSKEGVTVLNEKGKFPEDWFVLPYLRGKEVIGYRTQKPEALLQRVIEASSKKGDLVLDCFAGGGTTAKVCAELGRRFVCGDISPVAVRVMAARLNRDCAEVSYRVEGLPRTAQELKAMDGHAFADLVCRCMGWDVNEKKTSDGGIDGWAKHQKVPVQIKNHRTAVGRPDIQRFVGAIQKTYKEGIFVAWAFSRQATEYVADLAKNPSIILKSAEDIFGDLLITDNEQQKILKYCTDKSKGQLPISETLRDNLG